MSETDYTDTVTIAASEYLRLLNLQARHDKALELLDRARPWSCAQDRGDQGFFYAAIRAALTGEGE